MKRVVKGVKTNRGLGSKKRFIYLVLWPLDQRGYRLASVRDEAVIFTLA